MSLTFETVFTSSEAYAKFLFAMILFPLVNNFTHNHPDPKKVTHFNLTVKLPRWLLAIMLLFPSKHLKYKVEIFSFISECVFVILVVVFSVLTLQNVQLAEAIQYGLPRYMIDFLLVMWVCAMVDSHFYYSKNK